MKMHKTLNENIAAYWYVNIIMKNKVLTKWCITFFLALDGDIDSQIDKYIQNIGNEWICTACGKSVKNRVHLRNHIEAQHIVTPGFPCDICGFVSKTRPALRGHKDYNHKIKV